jgi:prepilin-type N-terminal cleavage/methylation domain-containing protein
MRETRGFTLIELLIIVAIILIIGTIALPNLMDSRMRANEASAIDRLKSYAEAQRIFKRERHGQNPENAAPTPDGYASDFRLLHYGAKNNPAAGSGVQPLDLSTKAHADAFIASTLSGTAPGGESYGQRAALNGYYFMDPVDFPPGVTAAEFFADGFAHLAVPDLANNTGNHMYFVDAEGALWRRPLDKGISHVDSSAYPTPLGDASGWEPF